MEGNNDKKIHKIVIVHFERLTINKFYIELNLILIIFVLLICVQLADFYNHFYLMYLVLFIHKI